MSSDIPHHVSSYELIDSLMVSMTAVLKCLPKPSLITMARYALLVVCSVSNSNWTEWSTIQGVIG